MGNRAAGVLIVIALVIILVVLSQALPWHWVPYAVRGNPAKRAEAYECSLTGIMMSECLTERYGWPETPAAIAALEELRKQQQGR